MPRIVQHWHAPGASRPAVTVKGPHNRSSNKWGIDLTHSALALYWGDNPDRARRELRMLREALDFIEAQLFPVEPVGQGRLELDEACLTRPVESACITTPHPVGYA